jgi:hypothetical protein
MTTRIVIAIALLMTAALAQAEATSPLFGSSTQEAVQIAIDPATSLPVIAGAEQPQPIVAARE